MCRRILRVLWAASLLGHWNANRALNFKVIMLGILIMMDLARGSPGRRLSSNIPAGSERQCEGVSTLDIQSAYMNFIF